MVIVYIVYHLSCDTNFASIPAPSNCAINWVKGKLLFLIPCKPKLFILGLKFKKGKLSPHIFQLVTYSLLYKMFFLFQKNKLQGNWGRTHPLLPPEMKVLINLYWTTKWMFQFVLNYNQNFNHLNFNIQKLTLTNF